MPEPCVGFGDPEGCFCISPLPPLTLYYPNSPVMENDIKIDYQNVYNDLIKHLEYDACIGSSATVQHFHLLSQLNHIFFVKRIFIKLQEEVKQEVRVERWLTINIDSSCTNQPIHYGVERDKLIKDEGGIEQVQIQTSYLSDSLYSLLDNSRVNDYIGNLNATLWSPVNNQLLFDLITDEMEKLKNDIQAICSLLKAKFKKEKHQRIYAHEYNYFKEQLAQQVEEDFENWENSHECEELASYVNVKLGWEMRKLFQEAVFCGHLDENMQHYRAEADQIFDKYDDTIYRCYAELRNYFQFKEGRLEPQKEKISQYLFNKRVSLTENKRKQLFYFILFSERIYQAIQTEKPIVEKEVLKEIIRLLEQWPDYLKTSAQWALVYVYCRKCFLFKMNISTFEKYVENELSAHFAKRCKASTVQKAKKRDSWGNNKPSTWKDQDDQALVDFLNERLPYTQKWKE